MSPFIQLTAIDGEPVWIRGSAVISVNTVKIGGQSWTAVWTGSDEANFFPVADSVADVLAAILKAEGRA
jgi:hypothetical protein